MKLTPGPPPQLSPYLCRQQTLVTVISHKLKATLWRWDQNIDFYFILLWQDSPETILITQKHKATACVEKKIKRMLLILFLERLFETFVISQKLLAHLKTAGTYLFVKKQFTRQVKMMGESRTRMQKYTFNPVLEEDIRFWFLLFGSAFE